MKLEKQSLGNLARELPDFAGVIRYETTFELKDGMEVTRIDLGEVGGDSTSVAQ